MIRLIADNASKAGIGCNGVYAGVTLIKYGGLGIAVARRSAGTVK